MVWHEIFPTHEVEKLHHFYKDCAALHNLSTLFDNTNAVSKPEQSDQIVYGVFCQTFTKSCQIQCGKQARAEWPDCVRCILPNIYKILPNYKSYCRNTAKYLHIFFIKRFTEQWTQYYLWNL